MSFKPLDKSNGEDRKSIDHKTFRNTTLKEMKLIITFWLLTENIHTEGSKWFQQLIRSKIQSWKIQNFTRREIKLRFAHRGKMFKDKGQLL